MSIASPTISQRHLTGSSNCLLYASDYLSKPMFAICESSQWIHKVDTLYAEEGVFFRGARKICLAVQMVFWSLVALFCLLPAFFLRGVGNYLLDEPFIHTRGSSLEVLLDENRRSFTLLSWNVCCIPGFSLESGVIPYPLRIGRIAKKIIQENCDVVCLSEVFDTLAATKIREKLAESGYAHFYSTIGPKNVGLNSGLFVASKFAVQNPHFAAFKNHGQIERGAFSFDLVSAGNRFARIVTTHLHSSEVTKSPSVEEIAIRAQQMECVIEQISKEEICTLIAGDLNLDDVEMASSSWYAQIDKGEVIGDKSWGGDSISAPQNLDHVLAMKRGAAKIQTIVKEVGFDPNQLTEEALSDHAILRSEIHLRAPQSQIQ